MKSIVRGLTPSVITLNKSGITIRGIEDAVIDIDTPEKKNEVAGLVRAGFVEVIDSNDFSDESMIKGKSEEQRVKEAEAKTDVDGSRVVIGTGKGNIESKMVRNAIDRFLDDESDRIAASIQALKQIEAEEAGENVDKNPIDETILPPSEQMGRPATISTGDKEKKEDMVNSVLGTNKDRDPFIDRETNKAPVPKQAKKRGRPKKIVAEKTKVKIPDVFIETKTDVQKEIIIDTKSDNDKNDGEFSDSFIEI